MTDSRSVVVKLIVLATVASVAGCSDTSAPGAPADPPAEAASAGTPRDPGGEATPRPMDEVPQQENTADGSRQYRFANGCVVVLEARQAVVKSEGAECASHHRDIALLYASGD